MMKCTVQNYKRSINESSFSTEQISMIWDFYVTKSVASTASQKRTASDYDLKQFPFKKMLEAAAISDDNYHILMADKIPKTLEIAGLKISGDKGVPTPIEIETPRFALIMGYSITDNDEPKPKDNCSKPECLLTHIRNALAHGKTYFFKNGKLLLVDKNKSNTTAMILIRQKTLLDWIKLIDHKEKFYRIINTAMEREE